MMTIGNGDGNDMFESLYQQYHRRVIDFYVRAFRLSEQDAEDLAQEAFLRFFEAMQEYRGDAGWAYFEKIARNVLYNRWRAMGTQKRSGRPVPLGDVPPSNQPSVNQPDYAAREAVRLMRKRFREAYEGLPRGQRQCVQMRMEGFSYKEIAVALKTTDGAVKTRLRDAKKTLRAQLGDELGDIVSLELPEEES